MSERKQHTAASMREKMQSYYDDDIHHKHNKNHLSYPPNRMKKESLLSEYNSEDLIKDEISRKNKQRKLQRRVAQFRAH